MNRLLIALWGTFAGWLAFCYGYFSLIRDLPTNWQNTASVLLPGVFLILLYFSSKSNKINQLAISLSQQHTISIDLLASRNVGLWIALAAGLGLYMELMVIRIHSSYFQLFAYFKNVSLLSCFLGLGIGYARGGQKHLWTPLVFPMLALQIIFLFCLRNSDINMYGWLQNPISEQVAFGIRQAAEFNRFVFVYGFIIMMFSFNALCFIPLGQLASYLMDKQGKLYSYSWNLIGSIGGVVLFSAISFVWSPPLIWILLLVPVLLLVFKNDLANLSLSVFTSLILVGLLSIPAQLNRFDFYSPYQILTLMIDKDAVIRLETSNTYYQTILDLSRENVKRNPRLYIKLHRYDTPYQFKKDPNDVLIVGSGTGNDVAAALRHGVRSIDAVEIDPVILEFGRKIHPESPYQDPRVTAHVNDARNFIRHAKKEYDMIIYGLLDAHVLLSGRSGGIRLDSYVYTVEAFREAREKLKKDGMISLTFAIHNHAFGQKIFNMLREAFDGRVPIAIQAQGAVIFLAGDTLDHTRFRKNPIDITKLYLTSNLSVDNSTDDWPFLYMSARKYPVSYMVLILTLLIISFIFIKSFVIEGRAGFSFPCFFLGCGFMLLETKAITELALVYGSTWIVISVVIIAVFLMAFGANWLVIKNIKPSLFLIYLMLCGALILGYTQSISGFEIRMDWLNKLLMTGILTLPLFFAGFAFSSELNRSPSVATALSSNLWGAMLGGFLEYNAMYFGFRSLYLLAILMYILAFVFSRKGA